MEKILFLSFLQSNRFLRIALVLTVILGVTCKKSSNGSSSLTLPVNYSGNFVPSGASGTQDSTKATGTVTATFNTSTLVLSYSISWNSLTSYPVAMHFHDAGPVIVPLTGFPVSKSGNLQGKATLTAPQGSDLAASLIYAMIHTQNYSAGEIQATLVKQ